MLGHDCSIAHGRYQVSHFASSDLVEPGVQFRVRRCECPDRAIAPAARPGSASEPLRIEGPAHAALVPPLLPRCQACGQSRPQTAVRQGILLLVERVPDCCRFASVEQRSWPPPDRVRLKPDPQAMPRGVPGFVGRASATRVPQTCLRQALARARWALPQRAWSPIARLMPAKSWPPIAVPA
jgi:hypothetical protein